MQQLILDIMVWTGDLSSKVDDPAKREGLAKRAWDAVGATKICPYCDKESKVYDKCCGAIL